MRQDTGAVDQASHRSSRFQRFDTNAQLDAICGHSTQQNLSSLLTESETVLSGNSAKGHGSSDYRRSFTGRFVMAIRYSILSVALTTLVVACGGSETKAVAPAVQTFQLHPASVANAKSAKPSDDPTRGNIKIADNVRNACGLADSDAHFAFDSAHVRDQDRRVLRALANCFGSGPLKGRQMSLIGHADPRGAGDYNLALGGRRADNVKRVLVAEAMTDGRVSTTSRGAMDATGTDEVSWAADRFVDIALGN
jgi:peptidoglycan-associated lipoprotein